MNSKKLDGINSIGTIVKFNEMECVLSDAVDVNFVKHTMVYRLKGLNGEGYFVVHNLDELEIITVKQPLKEHIERLKVYHREILNLSIRARDEVNQIREEKGWNGANSAHYLNDVYELLKATDKKYGIVEMKEEKESFLIRMIDNSKPVKESV